MMVQCLCDGGYGLQPCVDLLRDYLRVTDNKGKTHDVLTGSVTVATATRLWRGGLACSLTRRIRGH